MTRKDYVAIAAALAKTRPDDIDADGWKAYGVWYRVYDAIADVLEADNPRFDRLRFAYAASDGRTVCDTCGSALHGTDLHAWVEGS